MLLKMKMDDTRHRSEFLWFDSETGDVLCGPDEYNLVFAASLEFTGRLLISLVDLKNAFLLGKSAAEDRF